MSVPFDPLAPPDDPYPLYRRLRDEAPVHHSPERGVWSVTRFDDVPRLMDKLASNPRKELMVFSGGVNQGDPCLARAYHGFNGIEAEVVERIAAWITR